MKSRWLVCVLALAVGCGESSGTGGNGGGPGAGGSAGMGGGGVGGNGGRGGVGGTVTCLDDVCPCSEAGIRAAIAEGGGPFTFDCDGPTEVATDAVLVIDNDVILDGEGDLIISGRSDHGVLQVGGVSATLDGITVTGGFAVDSRGGGIRNEGTLTLRRCMVSGNFADQTRFQTGPGFGGGGIYNLGTLTVVDSTVSENGVNRGRGGGIYSVASGDQFPGDLTIINSTISGNTVDEGRGGGIAAENDATVILSSSTVARNSASAGGSGIAIDTFPVPAVVTKSIFDGDCAGGVNSDGYNIESPGDTCGFEQPTDQVNVPAPWLDVLGDNGGPTMTHALLAPSVAIDVIPEADCVDLDGEPLTTDQRGEPRPGGTRCDVGAFEVQP